MCKTRPGCDDAAPQPAQSVFLSPMLFHPSSMEKTKAGPGGWPQKRQEVGLAHAAFAAKRTQTSATEPGRRSINRGVSDVGNDEPQPALANRKKKLLTAAGLSVWGFAQQRAPIGAE
jgi:hypothetical protein